MTTLYLHGSLKQFGESYEVVDGLSVRSVIKLIAVQVKGLSNAILNGTWKVSRGTDFLTKETLDFKAGKEVHVYPAIHGAGGSTTQILIGAALIGLAFTPLGAVAIGSGALGVSGAAAASGTLSTYLVSAGVGMMLSGVMSMFTKVPEAQYDKKVDSNQKPSFLFDGPVNVSTQGMPVPIIIGRCLAGSVVVSAGMSVSELSAGEYKDLTDD